MMKFTHRLLTVGACHGGRSAVTRRQRMAKRAPAKSAALHVQRLESRCALAVGDWVNNRGAVATRVDTTSPAILSITPPAARTYGEGETMAFRVTFTEPVAAMGIPTLPIAIGDNVRLAAWNGKGSGGRTLVFTTAVQPGDLEATGVRVAGPIGLADGAGIRDRAGNALIPDASGTFRGVRADAVGPQVTEFGPITAAGNRLVLKVTFTEPVTVRGRPSIPFALGDAPLNLVYASGSGGRVLTFEHKAAGGRAPTLANVTVPAGTISFGGGRITDAAGNPATLREQPAAVVAPAPNMAKADVAALAGMNTDDAYYSSYLTTIQSMSPAGLRSFFSTDQRQYGEQSFVWGGVLVSPNGGTSVLDVEMQRDEKSVGPTHGVLAEDVSAAILYNDGSGWVVGGMGGPAEEDYPVAFTRIPWSVRASQDVPFGEPQFVDARVVQGQFGMKGAVYELTGNVFNVSSTAPALERIEVYVRARDTTGVMQWGYGPSGFAPMWVFPAQRASIMNTYGGSVGDYLRATGDPMRSQGQYYFTIPLLKVEKYVVSKGGAVVNEGSKGWLWMDNVARSFSPQAEQVVNAGGGIGWNEFSVFIPATGDALKIGQTFSQLTESPGPVQPFPYAYLSSPGSRKGLNGALTPRMSWGMNDVQMTPIESSKWVSPLTGDTYYLGWQVTLNKARGAQKVSLTIQQAVPNQEAVIAGRSVFEGLFRVSGTIGGRRVEGFALQEYQIPGKGK